MRTGPYRTYPRFRAETEGEEGTWDLFRAAVALGETEFVGLDPQPYERQVQAFAEEMGRRGIGPEDGEGAVRALAAFFANELGYTGDGGNYYDPDNSYVHRVLERRRGIPITLTVILIETARRMELPLSGVSFPGHFLARYDGGAAPLFLDAFGGGRTLTPADLRTLLHQNLGNRVRLRDEFLVPAGKRQILVRMLRNLQNAHVRERRYDAALDAVERILLLQPGDSTALHAKGRIEEASAPKTA